MPTVTPPWEILVRYCPSPGKALITPLGQGNINDTFLVRSGKDSFVLQRINNHVFPTPQILIDNLLHLSHHLQSRTDSCSQRWQEAVLVTALDGSPALLDNSGSMWRALSYIGDSVTVSHIESPLQAEQTGWTLAHFHQRLTGLDVKQLQSPLPGFHQLSGYLRKYDQLILADSRSSSAADIQFCLETIRNERESALLLEKTLARGEIQPTVTHGDPKVANVLFDRESGLAVGLIDLDTVGPGLLQHDLGDCLRSVCNRAGEESDPAQAAFDPDLYRITLQGYFQEGDHLLSALDTHLIYDGVKAITFELGLRFFIDFLEGGIYFKCKDPQETLHKGVVQFFLLHDIIRQEKMLRSLTLPTL